MLRENQFSVLRRGKTYPLRASQTVGRTPSVQSEDLFVRHYRPGS